MFVELIQDFKHYKPSKFCKVVLFIFLILFIILLLLPCYFIIQRIIESFYTPQNEILAITDDVIDCDLASKIQKNFVESVEITQKATDESNDNSKGLPMNIASISRKDLNYFKNTYTGNSSKVVPKSTKYFIIPDGYINEPVYLWKMSNISIQVNISDYTAHPPARLEGYIIYGDDNLNTFASNPSSTPNYVYSWNVLDWNQQTYIQSVDRNGYYFIVITVQTEHDFTLSAKVDFNYFYLNASDYDLSNGRYVETVGIPVRQKLDFYNNDVILCFVGTSPSDYDSIHVILKYKLRFYFVFVVSLVSYCGLIIITILFVIFLACLKLVRNQNACKSCDCFKSHFSDHKKLTSLVKS